MSPEKHPSHHPVLLRCHCWQLEALISPWSRKVKVLNGADKPLPQQMQAELPGRGQLNAQYKRYQSVDWNCFLPLAPELESQASCSQAVPLVPTGYGLALLSLLLLKAWSDRELSCCCMALTDMKMKVHRDSSWSLLSFQTSCHGLCDLGAALHRHCISPSPFPRDTVEGELPTVTSAILQSLLVLVGRWTWPFAHSRIKAGW